MFHHIRSYRLFPFFALLLHIEYDFKILAVYQPISQWCCAGNELAPLHPALITDKARQTFTDTFQGSLLLSTQGMAGGFAKAAPHRLYRGPEEAFAPSGSWRALCVCSCGDPYCWCEIVKVQGFRLDLIVENSHQLF
jgi:hypothetical protein